MPDKIEETNCYTYKVEMILQVLAVDEPTAATQLEQNGGYITSRTAVLMDSTPLFSGPKK